VRDQRRGCARSRLSRTADSVEHEGVERSFFGRPQIVELFVPFQTHHTLDVCSTDPLDVASVERRRETNLTVGPASSTCASLHVDSHQPLGARQRIVRRQDRAAALTQPVPSTASPLSDSIGIREDKQRAWVVIGLAQRQRLDRRAIRRRRSLDASDELVGAPPDGSDCGAVDRGRLPVVVAFEDRETARHVGGERAVRCGASKDIALGQQRR
jgi:hypothetical protein